MNIYIPEIDEIYFSKTREYFQEVLSSYASGNYRSAIVMLYSVTICDVLFKLQELKDMYNDTVAIRILEKVEKTRTNSDSKSKWEKELLDQVYKETNLLDLEAYTNLMHLYDHRNFSAHPALNENYELISPSKEITIAHIKNILNEILLKPPIFIKNIFSTLVDDLKQKSDLYIHDKTNLAIYLDNKYFSRMTMTMKIKLFTFLWKICFIVDNEDCQNNLLINRRALEILSVGIEREAEKEIEKNQQKFTVTYNKTCTWHLIIFLSHFPMFYNRLSQETVYQINNEIENNDQAKAISWFKASSLRDHILWLQNFKNLELTKHNVNYLVQVYKDKGDLTCAIDFLIGYYGNSSSYLQTKERFNYAIQPYLEEFNHDQCIRLIQFIDSNNQIYNYVGCDENNNKIVKSRRKILGDDFDYEQYPNFKFNKDVLTQTEESQDISDEQFNIDEIDGI